MRLYAVFPSIALAALFTAMAVVPRPGAAEPSEAAMRALFERTLADHVRNALEFAAASGGPESVAQIRKNGTDRFSIKVFRKLGCLPHGEGAHVCDFAVDIGLANGGLTKTLRGQFRNGADRIVLLHDT